MLPSCLIGCGYMTEYGHGPACKLYAETHPDTELAATLYVLPCAGCTMERLACLRARESAYACDYIKKSNT